MINTPPLQRCKMNAIGRNLSRWMCKLTESEKHIEVEAPSSRTRGEGRRQAGGCTGVGPCVPRGKLFSWTILKAAHLIRHPSALSFHDSLGEAFNQGTQTCIDSFCAGARHSH